jgi:hypothetical protein
LTIDHSPFTHTKYIPLRHSDNFFRITKKIVVKLKN